MKITKHIFHAIIIALTITSCATKEADYDDNQEPGRVITAIFESNQQTESSKTTPVIENGLTITEWCTTDQIWISNGDVNKLVCFKTPLPDGGILGTISKDKRSVTFEIPTDWTKVYAVYPASAAVGNCSSAKTLHRIAINIPQIQDGSYSNSNICIAYTENSTLKFKNATALMKIGGFDSSISSKCTIKSAMIYASTAVAGNFTATYSAETGVKVSLSPISGNTVKQIKVNVQNPSDITSNPCYFAIGNTSLTSNDKFVVLDDKSNVYYKYLSLSQDKEIQINHCYNLGNSFGENFTLKNNALSDTPNFSIADGDKVYFSRGNLVASLVKQSSYNIEQWWFNIEQYDCGCQDNAYFWNTFSLTESDKPYIVDLFCWSADNFYGLSNYHSSDKYKESFKDWGSCPSLKATLGEGWFTLSQTQWDYLIRQRSASTIGETVNARYAIIKVNNQHGLLVFPDTFTWNTSSMGNIPSFINESVGSSTSKIPKYSIEQFNAIEAEGGLFLPSSSWTSNGGTYKPSGGGSVWSSTGNIVPINLYYAYYLYYYLETGINNNGRSSNRGVRLVHR